MRLASWVFIVGATLGLDGCGMKGPLFLPDKNASVVTRPGTANTTTTAPAPGSSTTPAQAAPGDTGTAAPTSPPQQDKSKDDSQSSGSPPKN